MDRIDKNKKIIVIGTVFVDIKGYPERSFDPAGRNSGRIEYKYGGVARNVAADLAGLGLHPLFLSMTDDTAPGAAILQDLIASGVNTEYVLHGTNCIGTWMAILDLNGDVYANMSRRQNLLPVLSLLEEQGDEIFREAAGVLLEMDVEEKIVSEVFRLAEKHHTKVYGVISNMNIALEMLPYIQKTGCFVCNRQEAGLLFGRDMQDKSPQDALRMLKEGMQDRKIPTMVVTMDKDGAVFAGEKEEGYCPAKKVKIIDSTGAGDAYFTGVSVGFINGMRMADACRIGTEMASVVIESVENVYKNGG